MLPCICPVIDHRGRQNVVRTSVTHSAIASCATFLFLPEQKEHQWHTRLSPRVPLFCSYHILTSSVIYYWTDARQHGIYLLMSWFLLGPSHANKPFYLPISCVIRCEVETKFSIVWYWFRSAKVVFATTKIDCPVFYVILLCYKDHSSPGCSLGLHISSISRCIYHF